MLNRFKAWFFYHFQNQVRKICTWGVDRNGDLGLKIGPLGFIFYRNNKPIVVWLPSDDSVFHEFEDPGIHAVIPAWSKIRELELHEDVKNGVNNSNDQEMKPENSNSIDPRIYNTTRRIRSE